MSDGVILQWIEGFDKSTAIRFTPACVAQFAMPSGRLSGALLRALAAGKPGGQVLELGTGPGLATCWMAWTRPRACSAWITIQPCKPSHGANWATTLD